MQRESGILSEEIWLARKSQALGMLYSENFRSAYERNRKIFIPGFIAEIDEALMRLPEQ